MLGTIRRHQTWLWIIIVALTIGSFVVLGPTNTKMGNLMDQISGRQDAGFGYMGGKPITRAEFSDIQKEVLLGYYLKNGQWPREDSVDLTKETYVRLFILQQAKEMGIQISTDAAAAYVKRDFPANFSMEEFVEHNLKPAGLSSDDFERFLRHDLAMRQVEQIAGLSGSLVTPQEAENIYRAENHDLESSIVYFSASNYLTSVTVTPDEIAKYYTNQMANYRLPDQVKVDYVKFSLSNYTAAAQASLTNLNQMVDTYQQNLGTNYFHGTKTLAESKAAIRNEYIRRETILEARKAAVAFAQGLFDMKPVSAANLEKLAASNHVTMQTTAPFDSEYGPADINVGPQFAHDAFRLTPEDPYAGPIIPDPDHPAMDGVYVIALKDRIPSRVPPLKEIEAKVTADYRNAHAIQTAQQAALHFDSMVTNSLAQGKSFKAICADAGVKPETLPPFSLSTRSLPESVEQKVNFGMLRQVAFSTPAGKASPAAPANDGAFVLYVDKTLPVNEIKLKLELPAFLAYVRQAREGDAFNQWLNNQIRRDPEFMQTLQQRLNNQSQTRAANGQRSRS